MKDFNNKVVVITGAASGIGRALAQEFAKLGSKLAIMDFNGEGLEETVKSLPSATKVYTEIFDVSEKEKVFAFYR
jgi:NADP-dependent 3-hydroxy acid dehydrogenase YdfG